MGVCLNFIVNETLKARCGCIKTLLTFQTWGWKFKGHGEWLCGHPSPPLSPFKTLKSWKYPFVPWNIKRLRTWQLSKKWQQKVEVLCTHVLCNTFPNFKRHLYDVSQFIIKTCYKYNLLYLFNGIIMKKNGDFINGLAIRFLNYNDHLYSKFYSVNVIKQVALNTLM
jgi:hypothetical protein